MDSLDLSALPVELTTYVSKEKLDMVQDAVSSASQSPVGQLFFRLAIGWTCLLIAHFMIYRLIPNPSKEGRSNKKEKNMSKQHESHSIGVFYGNGPIPVNDTLALVIGLLMLVVLLPLVGTVVGLTVLWDWIDRAGQGRPQDGIGMSFARLVNRVTAPLWAKFMKVEKDGFIVNVIWFLGGLIPFLMFLSLDYTMKYGFSISLCVAYHIFRIGPYFMNFAYTYTLCHKEGHSRLGFFHNPVINFLFRNSFNWWIGLFYGVLPSSFAYGHSINHHKYNNGPLDVVSTSDKPRDNFWNFVRFLPRWLLYATNVSTIRQFIFQKEYKVAWSMMAGTIYYIIWIAVFWKLSPVFTFWYLIFPVGENILLLACIQWCWHGFVDRDDPDNPFVGSITLLGGPINVMGEDFHVVHHQYPGTHWSTHPQKFKVFIYFSFVKHESQYKDRAASTFRDTHAFEMFFLIILGEYKKMAEKYQDYSGKYPTLEDKENMVKERLRTCWWGPLAQKKVQQVGWEGVEESDGYE